MDYDKQWTFLLLCAHLVVQHNRVLMAVWNPSSNYAKTVKTQAVWCDHWLQHLLTNLTKLNDKTWLDTDRLQILNPKSSAIWDWLRVPRKRTETELCFGAWASKYSSKFLKKRRRWKKVERNEINQLTFNSVELPVVVTKSFSESRISKVWRSYSGGSILCCVPPHHLMSLFTRIDPYKPDGMRDLSMRRCGQREGAHKCKSHNGLLVARKTWISVFVYKREWSDEWKYFMYNIKQKIYLQIHRILS